MAIGANTLWEFNTSATGSMVNGGGFNISNANFLTDGSITSATGTAPVLSSASYNFGAGDIGNWIYLTNVTKPGFYKISSVASNQATLNATSGQGIVQNATTLQWVPSSSAGVDSSSSVSGKTFGVDYSQTTAANLAGITDFSAIGASTTLTSVTAGFKPTHVGNFYHQVTTGTGAFGVVGWYEIVSYVNATTVVLDRTPNSGTASVNCTGSIGGALDMAGTLQDSFFEQIQGGNIVFIKSGAYTAATGWSVASTNSTLTSPSNLIGYNSLRGDEPTIANSPVITVAAASGASFGQFQNLRNMSWNTSGSSGLATGTGARIRNLRARNTSTTAARPAISIGQDAFGMNLDATSQLGPAITLNSAGASVYDSYIHDSDTGILANSTRQSIVGNIIESNKTIAISYPVTTGQLLILNNTLYGAQTPLGTGILLASGTGFTRIANNIIYGFVTGITQTTTQSFSNAGDYNNFFNNTTDVSNYTKDFTDTAINPSFTSASQITGTVGKAQTGSKFQDSNKNFTTLGAIANRDYLTIFSGTATAGAYLITAISTTTNTNDTLTLNNSAGSGNVGDVVYSIPVVHNFYPIGTIPGYPGAFQGGLTTGFTTQGAVQKTSTSVPTGFFIQ